jgi:uncharacterized membrane protein
MKQALLLSLAVFLCACGTSEGDSEKKEAPQQKLPEETSIDVSMVEAVILERCATCHSAKPTDNVFKVAPSNVMFDTLEQMQRYAARIRARAVDAQTMPFMNKTNMTDEERVLLDRWVRAGAPVN